MVKDFLQKQKLKSKLIQAFRSGEMYLTYKKDKTLYYIMPKIHSVGFDNDNEKITYVFSIPLGLDPKEVLKKEWLFKQQFGKNIELEQENKRFTLTIRAKKLPKEVLWNFEQFEHSLKDKLLPIVCGIDLNGDLLVYDMVKHPHLLISGRTGSGKSTQLRSILSTLIKDKSPEELHLYMADLKLAEFQFYRNVEHVKKLCINKKEIKKMLSKLLNELEKRQELLVEHEVTHVKDLPNKLPYIIICIDEVATLKKDDAVMDILEEISNRGRALGIYLILSILRPDREILDGKLKNNLNVVMGFRCKDAINARVIGTVGAEKLTNKGRFLIDIETMEGLPEIQAPLLEEDELKKILKEYKVENSETMTSQAISWDFLNPNKSKKENVTPEVVAEDKTESKKDEIKFGLLGDDDREE